MYSVETVVIEDKKTGETYTLYQRFSSTEQGHQLKIENLKHYFDNKLNTVKAKMIANRVLDSYSDPIYKTQPKGLLISKVWSAIIDK